MLKVVLDAKLRLEGPILTKSSEPGNYGIDASMAKNHEGNYIIPGTLVKGRLRQSWEELRDLTSESYIDDYKINKLLGLKSGNSEDEDKTKPVTPFRSILRFSDFVCEEKRGTQELHRIRMNEESGTVAKGALLIMETPFAPGEQADFHGKISFFAENKAEVVKIKDYIDKGLRWITSLGSDKTVGFGKLIDIEFTGEDIKDISNEAKKGNAFPEYTYKAKDGKLCLIITPKTPFCIAKRKTAENLFESETFIPGSVIKGTIASVWGRILGKNKEIEIKEGIDDSRKELCNYFNTIRFRHALPAKSTETKRPVTPPLSLVKVKADGAKPYYDVVLCKEPILIHDKAPEFSIDWKSHSDVNGCFGWADITTKLIVRTAISRETRRAEDEKLFAYETIIPTGFHWLSWIDFGCVPEEDRQAVERQLNELLSYGLNGLGKTKASACAELKSPCHIQPFHGSRLEPICNQYIITLQTPAILCNPYELNETSSKDDLHKAYECVWNRISDSSLSLVRYFASQTLAGGYYLHRRFQGDKPYKPFLLTEAGSVFVLEVKNDKAQEKINEWHKYGLPLPDWAKAKYRKDGKEGDHWSNCPYIPENGYGEIVVNLDMHTSKKPKPEEVVLCQSIECGK